MAQNDPLFQWFAAVDRDRSGQIDVNELQQALTQSGLNGSWKPYVMRSCADGLQEIST